MPIDPTVWQDAAEDDEAAEERVIRHVLERRRRFEQAVAAATDPTPDERAELWATADKETRNAQSD